MPAPVPFTVSFTAQLTVYENQIRCHVNENELNMSQNPSICSDSSGSLYAFTSGSDFHPYVTAIGLYNGANQLLAVGKLSQPYPVPSNTDITFIVKYDS